MTTGKSLAHNLELVLKEDSPATVKGAVPHRFSLQHVTSSNTSEETRNSINIERPNTNAHEAQLHSEMESLSRGIKFKDDYHARLETGSEKEIRRITLSPGDVNTAIVINVLISQQGKQSKCGISFHPNQNPHWNNSDMEFAAANGIIITTERVGSIYVNEIEIRFTKKGNYQLNGQWINVGSSEVDEFVQDPRSGKPLKEFKLVKFSSGEPIDLFISGPERGSRKRRVNLVSVKNGEIRDVSKSCVVQRTLDGELRILCFQPGIYNVSGYWTELGNRTIAKLDVLAIKEKCLTDRIQHKLTALDNIFSGSYTSRERFEMWLQANSHLEAELMVNNISVAEHEYGREVLLKIYEKIWTDYITDEENDCAIALQRLAKERAKAPDCFPKLSESLILRFVKAIELKRKTAKLSNPFS